MRLLQNSMYRNVAAVLSNSEQSRFRSSNQPSFTANHEEVFCGCGSFAWKQRIIGAKTIFEILVPGFITPNLDKNSLQYFFKSRWKKSRHAPVLGGWWCDRVKMVWLISPCAEQTMIFNRRPSGGTSTKEKINVIHCRVFGPSDKLPEDIAYANP